MIPLIETFCRRKVDLVMLKANRTPYFIRNAAQFRIEEWWAVPPLLS